MEDKKHSASSGIVSCEERRTKGQRRVVIRQNSSSGRLKVQEAERKGQEEETLNTDRRQRVSPERPGPTQSNTRLRDADVGGRAMDLSEHGSRITTTVFTRHTLIVKTTKAAAYTYTVRYLASPPHQCSITEVVDENPRCSVHRPQSTGLWTDQHSLKDAYIFITFWTCVLQVSMSIR